MKHIKKIGALVLALVIVLAMSTTAFAAVGNDGKDTSGGDTLTFVKSILMKNSNGTTVREPNITYTYTITVPDAVDTNETVTDKDGNVGKVYKLTDEYQWDTSTGAASTDVKATLADVLTTNTATAEFSNVNKVTASVAGTEDTKNVTFTFNGANFPHAGIYRFIISEASDVTKASVGITEADNYSDTMFLDVYVKGTGTDTEIYAYVLFEENASDITKANEDNGNANEKSAGWSGGDPGSTSYTNEDSQNQDIYQTYDLEVSKVVDGDATSKNHYFPFEITLANPTLTTVVDIEVSNANLSSTYTATLKDASTATNAINLSSTGNLVEAKLKDEGKVTLKGIPSATTVLVNEQNDTYDVYKVTNTNYQGFSDKVVADDTLNAGVSTNNATAVTINDATQLSKIEVTNKLTEVSPTGVVLRIAPYALMLGAGIVLLLITRRRREDAQAA